MNRKKQLVALLCCASLGWAAYGAGTLTPADGKGRPAEILRHDVAVLINNGYARTEVEQEFRNPNPDTVEAIYAFPLPQSASLSEVEVTVGEQRIQGEVVDKKTADRIYGEEKEQGKKAALATKDGHQDFTFRVANLTPNEVARVKFVYYQPLPVDTGVVRYCYPLEEGNTKDAAALAFWSRNDRPSGKTTLRLTVKSAWPLAGVRVPGLNAERFQADLAKGTAEATYELADGLTRDFVCYYQLAENLPGRLEVIPFRRAGDKEGTYMMVLTPGIDLQPLTGGADYVFVLDRSGSMSGSKLRTLLDGVSRTLGQMQPQDRFRIITFESRARDLTGGYCAATPENVRIWSEKLGKVGAAGGTNLYAGLAMALNRIDADRVTSVVVVTDGETNIGNVTPAAFRELLKKQDVRLFGFLMGNQANWPLMRVICEASGGFYDSVSNSDDIIGKIMLAKSKIAYECIHDAKVRIDGVKTFDRTGDELTKLYRGQQMVMFGRYAGQGRAEVKLEATISGRRQTYRCLVDFPAADTDNPELERLWGLARIEMFEALGNAGVMPGAEVASAVRDLGVRCQLVTDETSMLVLDDAAFERHGIRRQNQARLQE